MHSFVGILKQTLRHAAFGVAVMAVLMLTFRIHLHVQAHDAHDHRADLSLGGMPDDEPGSPSTPEDPDGCGHCHCPASSAVIVDIPAFVFSVQMAGSARQIHAAAAPDSPTYPPDPPPVRLS